MKTILVGIPCLMNGGTEVQTLSLVEALICLNYKVVVACYFEYDDRMVERYRKAGASVHLLSPYGKRPDSIKSTVLFLWHGLRSVVKDIKPDVAHIQYMAPGLIPIIILKALGVKKIIATSHTSGDIYSTNGLRVIRFLTEHVLTVFQCITQLAEKSYFGESHLFDGKLTSHFTIYNNIPSHISILDKPRDIKTADSPIVVGVISRLESIKGMDLVVPAFIKALKRNRQLRLLVVGDGSQRKLMKQQVHDGGIDDRVEFAGFQPQDKLQGFYDRIDIILMPSRSEGFGLTAIEGMARGCVPVVANVGGLPEVIGNSGCGLLHEKDNVEDIAEKICVVSKSINDLSSKSLNRSLSFSKKRYIRNISALYSAVLSQ